MVCRCGGRKCRVGENREVISGEQEDGHPTGRSEGNEALLCQVHHLAVVALPRLRLGQQVRGREDKRRRRSLGHRHVLGLALSVEILLKRGPTTSHSDQRPMVPQASQRREAPAANTSSTIGPLAATSQGTLRVGYPFTSIWSRHNGRLNQTVQSTAPNGNTLLDSSCAAISLESSMNHGFVRSHTAHHGA